MNLEEKIAMLSVEEQALLQVINGAAGGPPYRVNRLIEVQTKLGYLRWKQERKQKSNWWEIWK